MHINSEKANCIRDIAFHLFVDEGYNATSIRKICCHAQIDPPTLYYYFESKKGLFFSIANLLFSDYKEAISEAKEACNNMSASEQLFYIFNANMQPSSINQNYSRFFFRFSLFPPQEISEELSILLCKIKSFQFQLTEDAILECINQRLIKAELERANNTFWRFVNNNIFDIMFSDWQPIEKELKELWNTFFQYRLSNNSPKPGLIAKVN